MVWRLSWVFLRVFFQARCRAGHPWCHHLKPGVTVLRLYEMARLHHLLSICTPLGHIITHSVLLYPIATQLPSLIIIIIIIIITLIQCKSSRLEALCIFKPYNNSILIWSRHVHPGPVRMCNMWLLRLLSPLDLIQRLHTSLDLPSLSLTMTMIAAVPNLLFLQLGLKASLVQFCLEALELISVVHRVIPHITSH